MTSSPTWTPKMFEQNKGALQSIARNSNKLPAANQANLKHLLQKLEVVMAEQEQMAAKAVDSSVNS